MSVNSPNYQHEIIWLADINDQNWMNVGSKTARLSSLLKSGVAVPDGFCITNSVYQEYLYSQFSTSSVLKLIKNREFEKIRIALLNGKDKNSFFSRLIGYYQQLITQYPGPVAVRSSSTAEDQSSHSFAGLYDTVLNIYSEEELVEAVKKCWASYWNAEAVHYREEAYLNHLNYRMSILVQVMIDASMAGVIFTQSPLINQQQWLIGEVVRSNGEALVSGDISGEQFFIDRITGEVVETGFTGSLDASFCRGLSELALLIEKDQGSPQDIEWCLDKNAHIWILQTRPITVSPMQQDFAKLDTIPGWNRYYDEPFSPLGCDLAVRRHKYWVEAINHYYKTSFEALTKVNSNLIYYKPVWRKPGKFVRVWMKFWKFIRWVQADSIYNKYICEDLPEHHNALARLEVNISSLSDRFLLANFNQAIHAYFDLQYFSLPMIEIAKTSVDLFQYIFSYLFSKTNGLEVSKFITGLDNISVTRDMVINEMGRRLKKILPSTEIAKLDFATLQLFEQGDDDQKDLWHALQSFLNQYGYVWADRYPRDPAWKINQDALLASLTQVAKMAPDNGISSGHVQQKEQRVRSLEEARQSLSIRQNFSLRFRIFNFILRRVENYYPHKENRNHDVYQAVMVIQKYANEIGLRLQRRGLIQSKDDIFFLTWEEIQNVFTESDSTDNLDSLLEERRQEFKRSKQMTDRKVRSHSDASSLINFGERSVLEIRGDKCSSGVAFGTARLVFGLGELHLVQAGDILICHNMRPAWSSVFTRASAVVVEVGGVLSHGATLAREYGIPAIMNIPNITKIVADGDKVIVDGNSGTVTIEKGARHSSALLSTTRS